MKRIQLGLAICSVAGIVLFGASSPEAAAGPSEPPSTEVAAANAHAAPVEMGMTPTGLVAKVPLSGLSPLSRGLASVGAAAAQPVDVGTGHCPAGMLEVEGDYCPSVEQKCLRWLDPEEKMRCAEFAPAGPCASKTAHKKFCIDRYEYPNVPGERPVIMKTWYEAKATCEGSGKRLCGESEWTLACEGQEHLPYPYGLARDADACNIDKPHPNPDEKALANPKTRDAEVARLDQRDPSGFRDACVSPYGVRDMTGNVDEWVVNESGHPYQSGLKGGYWGPVRTRCRPMTVAHNEQFSFYQIGFRCCSDTAGSQPAAGSRPNAPSAPASKTNPNPAATHTPSLPGS